MKIRNAIPPLALSALLISNVCAQGVEFKTIVVDKQSLKKSEKKVSGKINSPTQDNGTPYRSVAQCDTNHPIPCG